MKTRSIEVSKVTKSATVNDVVTSFEHLTKDYKDMEALLNKRLATKVFVGEEGRLQKAEIERLQINLDQKWKTINRFMNELKSQDRSKPSNSIITFLNEQEFRQLEMPPKAAMFLVCLFIPKAECENRLGDLQEEFEYIKETCGPRYAWFKYWLMVGESVGPLALERLRKLVGWLLKIGTGAGLTEILHRMLSK